MKVPEPRRLKSGTWFIQMRLGGVSVPVTASTKTECKHLAERIKSAHRSGLREARAAASDLTIRQGIDEYIKAKKNNLSPSTVRGYRIIQKNRFQDYMDRPMRAIKDWQAVYDSEKDRLSPKTLHNSFGLIRTVYQHCMKRQMPEVSELPVAQRERAFLDAEQIEVFLKAVKGQRCEIPALLALSSLRCSEILGLTWDNVDLKAKRISVHGSSVLDESNKLVHKETNKTAKSWRYVPIFIPQLQDALEAVEDKAGPVVTYQTESGMIRAINRVCQDAELPVIGLHSLRHSFASTCLHLGVPEETAMAIGGWSDFGTMRKIYTHVSQRDQEKHVSALTDFYKNANKSANRSLKSE